MSTIAPLGQLKPMGTTNIQGRNVPTAQAMLTRAHRDATDRGLILVGMDSTLVLPPAPPNMLVIVKVTLFFRFYTDTEHKGPLLKWEALGDADTQTGGRVSGRLVALAETRGTSRALSLALNLDQEALESGVSQAPQQGQFQPQQQQFQQPGAAPQYQQAPQGGGQGGWDGMFKWGKHSGKHVSDPSISMDDLMWNYNNLTLQDRQTPDMVKRNVVMAEIQRRQGGGGAAPMAQPQQYQQAAPQYAQPPQAMPMGAPPPMPGFAPQPLPQPQGAPVFNQQQPMAGMPMGAPPPMPMGQPMGQPGMPAPGMPVPGMALDPATVARITGTAAQKGMAIPQLNQYVMTTFGVGDVGLLQPAQAQQLEAVLASMQNVA
jgi:hypothetical protein